MTEVAWAIPIPVPFCGPFSRLTARLRKLVAGWYCFLRGVLSDYSVVFCKLGPVIEADKSVSSQLSVHLLNAGSPYQYFHSFVSSTMSPYFKSFIKDGGRTTRYINRKRVSHDALLWNSQAYSVNDSV